MTAGNGSPQAAQALRAGSVAVFCGSQPHPEFEVLAEDLGRRIARRGAGLVYGGGNAGLMGAVSKGAHEAGGLVTGVAPHHLFRDERTGPLRGEHLLVRSMHDRKALMYRLADAFVVLPGGLGTMDELWEATTWSQLGIHHRRRQKPVALLNWPDNDGEGYYDGLTTQMRRFVTSGFVASEHRSLITVTADTDRALDELGVPPERPTKAPETAG